MMNDPTGAALIVVAVGAALFLLVRIARTGVPGLSPSRWVKVGYPPSRIVPEPLGPAGPEDLDLSHGKIDALRQSGFADIGMFGHAGQPGRPLWAGIHRTEGITAVLSVIGQPGECLELSSHYQDGTSFATAVGPLLGWNDPAEGWSIESLQELDTAEAVRRHLENRPRKPLDPDLPSTFAERYAARYARIMDWRNARGGFTEEEIRRLQALTGASTDEADISRIVGAIRLRARVALDATLKERFLERAAGLGRDFSPQSHRLVIVHDGWTRYDIDGAIARFSRGILKGADVVGPDVPARVAMEVLNHRLKSDALELVGRIEAPVEADVYLRP